MSAYYSKDSVVQGRQLEAQSLVLTADLVNAKSDLPSVVTINNGTIASTVITIDVKETVEKAFLVQVLNRTSGAIIALAAAPTVSGTTIAVTVNGTGITSCSVEAIYKVAE